LWLEQDQRAGDIARSLQHLVTLHELGVLRDEEFQTARARMLG